MPVDCILPVTFLPSRGMTTDEAADPMSSYVLIHGAMHGAWCWERVIPLLQASGHAVIAPDLPGHGADGTPRAAVTLAHYVACVGRLLEAAAEPVVLVGHSMGGMVVSAALDAWPAKGRPLVYISPVVPVDGEALNEASGRGAWRHETSQNGPHVT